MESQNHWNICLKHIELKVYPTNKCKLLMNSTKKCKKGCRINPNDQTNNFWRKSGRPTCLTTFLWSLAIISKRLKKYCKKIYHNEKVINLSKSELADKDIELIIKKQSWKNWIETTELKESDQTQVSSLIIFPLDTSYKNLCFSILNL